LKAEIAKRGWPTISQVGKLAAGDAWLPAKHADDDLLFPLRVLRLMEPLVQRVRSTRAATHCFMIGLCCH
jgi:hypothetical protein